MLVRHRIVEGLETTHSHKNESSFHKTRYRSESDLTCNVSGKLKLQCILGMVELHWVIVKHQAELHYKTITLVTDTKIQSFAQSSVILKKY